MKKTAAVTMLAVAVMAAGCSSAAEPVAPAAPVGIANVPTDSPEPTPAPEEIDYSVRIMADAPRLDSAVDARYLGDVREWADASSFAHTTIPAMSDEALLDAATEACAQLPALGGDWAGVRVVEGEVTDGAGNYWDSQSIAARASIYYCTAYQPDVVVPWEPGNYSR